MRSATAWSGDSAKYHVEAPVARERSKHGAPHTVRSDTAAAHLMATGRVDGVVVGTDRTAASGRETPIERRRGDEVLRASRPLSTMPSTSRRRASSRESSRSGGVADAPAEGLGRLLPERPIQDRDRPSPSRPWNGSSE